MVWVFMCKYFSQNLFESGWVKVGHSLAIDIGSCQLCLP